MKRSSKTKDILEQMKAEGAANFSPIPETDEEKKEKEKKKNKIEKADRPVPVLGPN